MSATPCEVHEMPWCGICNGDLARQQAVEKERSWVGSLNGLPPGVTRAEWPTRCASCRDAIDPGDLIKHSDLASGWIGLDCCGS